MQRRPAAAPARGARFLLILSWCAGCAAAPPEATLEPDRTLVTPIDWLESGRKGVEAFLQRDTSGADLRRHIERCSRATTRVLISTRIGFGETARGNGSGALLAGGRLVVTAAHVVEGMDTGDLSVTFPDGRSQPARLVAIGNSHADWAILELHRPRPDAPAVSVLGDAAEGELAYVLGYPGGAGINAAGYVIGGDFEGREPLAPIVSIGRVLGGSPLRLDLVAGVEFSDGMSGGPVCNAKGELLGVGVASTFSADGTGAVRYEISAVPVGVFEDRLRGLWSSAPNH